jgi:xanthine dehydrogenase YagR molybdenum-binding subunit
LGSRFAALADRAPPHLVDEHDPHVDALSVEDVGEIGVTGTAGAVANAVWHATGIRVRRFPITLDRFIEPALA